MPESDWIKVQYYADKYNTEPELIAAIGWHETHWGQLGWGREGFYLGVGAYSETEADYSFQGLDNQLAWAAPRLGKYLDKSVTLERLTWFARNIWKPGAPDAWARSVYEIYLQLSGSSSGGTSAEAEEQACIQAGGVWDGQTCVFPQVVTTPSPAVPILSLIAGAIGAALILHAGGYDKLQTLLRGRYHG